MGTLILSKLKDYYPDKFASTHTVFPSPKVSDVVVEPYTAVLSMNRLLEYYGSDGSDATFIYDNEALFSIAHNILKVKDPKYSDYNFVIANVMSDVTAPFRLTTNNALNKDLRTFGTSMVPFPRLHFFLMAHAPLFGIDKGEDTNITMSELNDQIYLDRNFLSNCRAQDGRYMVCSTVYRGMDLEAVVECDEENYRNQTDFIIQNDDPSDFVEWLPHHISFLSNNILTRKWIDQNVKIRDQVIPRDIVELCRMFYSSKKPTYNPVGFMHPKCFIPSSPLNTAISGTMIANTTAIKTVFQRISIAFAKLYRRKAFLHYNYEGMDQMEYQEADKNCRDLITEYHDKDIAEYNDCYLDDDDEDGESEQEEEDVDDSDENEDEDEEEEF